MPKQRIEIEDLKNMEKSIILLHGVFAPAFFDELKKQSPEYVFILEGRPHLEAAKSSAQELLKRGMTPTIIADNMAGFLFYKDLVKEVCLSYVDTSKRGSLCFIGASILVLLARRHGVVVSLYPSGKKVKKEMIALEKDLLFFNGVRVAPKKTKAYVPLLEWVPIKKIED